MQQAICAPLATPINPHAIRDYYNQIRLYYRVAAEVWVNLPSPAITVLRAAFEDVLLKQRGYSKENWTYLTFGQRTIAARNFNMGE